MQSKHLGTGDNNKPILINNGKVCTTGQTIHIETEKHGDNWKRVFNLKM